MKLNLPQERKFVGNALLWKRIVAFLIDILILNFVIQFSFSGLFRRVIPEEGGFSEIYGFIQANQGFADTLVMVTIASSILILLYFVFMEKKMHQSIGKKIMNIYVVSAEKTENIKLWQHIVRNLLFIPVFPFILLWILDPLFMFLTSNNQRLSEILSKTKVVQEYNL
jgi:uncharacterized RDD family membrane protein YckC